MCWKYIFKPDNDTAFRMRMLVAVGALLIGSCCSGARLAGLRSSLQEFVAQQDATVGVAVIVNGKDNYTDTVAVNGERVFPMLSVYKFPIALAFADLSRREKRDFDSAVAFLPEDLDPDTYSPMTENLLANADVTTDSIRRPAKELLAYMLQLSDNNASDIILRLAGGAGRVADYLQSIDVQGVNVRNSEAEMHKDNALCYANCATPLAMAALMNKFDREHNDSLSMELKELLQTCSTGTQRLPKPLSGTGAVIGHKTGTGFVLPDGRLMAVNDAGYVHLPDGRRYSIAVFIENSGYDMAATVAIIAEISRIVFNYVGDFR